MEYWGGGKDKKKDQKKGKKIGKKKEKEKEKDKKRQKIRRRKKDIFCGVSDAQKVTHRK